MELPSLEVLKLPVDMALGGHGLVVNAGLMLGLSNLRRFFQP